MILMVCGSRHWTSTAEPRAYVQRVVERVIEQGHSIVMGDSQGVDEWVCEFVNAANYRKVYVYGLTPQPLNGWGGFYLCDHIGKDGIQSFTSDSHRDRYIAKLADQCLCIWNGSSDETLNVHNYAQSLGKKTNLITLTEKQRQLA